MGYMLLFVSTALAQAPWAYPNHLERAELQVDNTARGTLTGVPVLVRVNSTWVDFSETGVDGDALAFADATGAPIPHEIEAWNPGGTSFVWVRLSSVDGGSTAAFYAYWNGPAPAPLGTSVWDTTYRAVWHLDGMEDSTVSSLTATNAGSTDAEGRIGRGRAFNGIDHYIDTNFNTDLPTFTVEGWARPNSAPDTDNNGVLMRQRNYQINWDHPDTTYQAAGSIRHSGGTWVDSAFTGASAGTWHHFALTFDGAVLTSFVDGVQVDSATGLSFPDADTNTAKIGAHAFENSPTFDGRIDEVRIAVVARSADYLNLQHASVADTLLTVVPCQAQIWFEDSDDDGFGNPTVFMEGCADKQPPGMVDNSDDCDDDVKAITTTEVLWPDNDRDGFGDVNGTGVEQCPGDQLADNNLDCDDSHDTAKPGGTEVCGNGIDEDCANGPDDGCVVHTADSAGTGHTSDSAHTGLTGDTTVSDTDTDAIMPTPESGGTGGTGHTGAQPTDTGTKELPPAGCSCSQGSQRSGSALLLLAVVGLASSRRRSSV